MANTTNFGWETPDDTDLVKDGAAAIRTLGSAIDTSLVDLKGGTTGQVLSKASNTDLDFTWTNGGDITEVSAGTGISGGGTSGAVTITNSMATAIDAKGDLIAGTGADAFSRLAVGTNNQVLTADSTTATGLKWAAVSADSMTLISTTSLSGSTTTISSIPSTYTDLRIIIQGARTTSGVASVSVTFNNNTNNDYWSQLMWNGSVTQTQRIYSGNNNGWLDSTTADANKSYIVDVFQYANTSYGKTFSSFGSWYEGGNTNTQIQMGTYSSISAISSVEIRLSASTFAGGRVLLYGVK